VKVVAHVCCQLSISRMIGALQPDDSLIELGVVPLHIPQEVQFRHCRSNQQDLLGTRERGDDVVKEPGLVIGMIAGSRLLVLGPLVGWIVGALEGAAVGATAGVLAAALASIGIPKDSIVKYELDVKAGKFLVLARGTPEMIAHAHVILGTTGASLLAAHSA
jgi:hypothetical protein